MDYNLGSSLGDREIRPHNTRSTRLIRRQPDMLSGTMYLEEVDLFPVSHQESNPFSSNLCPHCKSQNLRLQVGDLSWKWRGMARSSKN